LDMDFILQTPEQLSAYLVAMRERAGFTQTELGLMMGVGQPRMAKIENDPTSISVGQLLRILGLLNARITIQQHSTSNLTKADVGKMGLKAVGLGNPGDVVRLMHKSGALRINTKSNAGSTMSSTRRVVREGPPSGSARKKTGQDSGKPRDSLSDARRQASKAITAKASGQNAKKSTRGNW
jgi:HTH-type transcriptional regulator/antitoxin HipB